ncbi:hypothetical protein J6590_014365 [Homalodisca vitripennis]|nr:hypothetical protein J6590_014365 [Homalodisca vitripennis]
MLSMVPDMEGLINILFMTSKGSSLSQVEVQDRGSAVYLLPGKWGTTLKRECAIFVDTVQPMKEMFG